MSRIADPEGALRLARAIVSDIVLYHEAAIQHSGPEVVEAIEEGRALFTERVEPHLAPLFENALADSRLAPWGEIVDPAKATFVTAPKAVAKRPLMTTEAERGNHLPLVLLLLLLVCATLGFLLLRK